MGKKYYSEVSGCAYIILFEKKGRQWKIKANEFGVYFGNEWASDYIVIYSDTRWACDYPERLPKYAVSAMNNLLKRYGAEGLKAICRDCA